jgi:hypothetical protein
MSRLITDFSLGVELKKNAAQDLENFYALLSKPDLLIVAGKEATEILSMNLASGSQLPASGVMMRSLIRNEK